jgi:hypothetical protein
MTYEIVVKSRGIERVVNKNKIRRLNGAIAERDVYAQSEYEIKLKRTEVGGGRVIRGTIADDPNGIAIVYIDEFSEITTVVTFRKKVQE